MKIIRRAAYQEQSLEDIKDDAVARVLIPERKVVKGMRIPPMPRQRGRPRTYEIIGMAVGDSFYVKEVIGEGDKPKQNARMAINYHKKLIPGGRTWKFPVDREARGWRFTRTE